MMNTLPSCMDRYVNRYIIPPPPTQQQQQSHQGYFQHSGHHIIHQQHHPHQQQHAHNYMVGCYTSNTNGWTGVPLISTATRRPRKFNNTNNNTTNFNNNNKNDFDENAMSRLAIHAQGAPLILSSRYRSKPNKSKFPTMHQKEDVKSSNQLINSNNTTDTLSVTSDESCVSAGSNHSSSDTCLPRIIKPRKRRKKDRKPNVTNSSQDNISMNANVIASSDNQNVEDQQIYQFSNNKKDVMNNEPDNALNANSNANESNANNMPSSCSCRLCDPFCKIWAFPLRRSCSDNTAEIELNRSKDVGVIGSNRITSIRNEWRSSPHSLDINDYNDGSRKGSLSDSGDSGCDILSGLNFSEDILSVNRDLFLTPVDNKKEFQFPNTNTNNVNEKSDTMNDLSKKISDTLDIRSDCVSSDGGSVFSDGVFSDSVPDFFVNFDSISRNNLFSVNNISKLSNLLFDDHLTAPGLVINSKSNDNNISNSKCNNSLFSDQQPYIFVQDKDRGCEVLNCFDMVWNDRKLLPVEE